MKEPLSRYVANMPIIDTHEHIKVNESERSGENDWMSDYLSAYFKSDLISCGLSSDNFSVLVDPKVPIEHRWKIAEPYWELCRYTGYGQALDLTVRGLYNIPSICADTVTALQHAYKEAWNTGTHYHYVLQQKCKIKVSLVDENLMCDRSFFRSVVRMDHFVRIGKFEDILAMEQSTGHTVCCLDDWLYICEKALDNALSAGAVALKIGLAYFRSLQFDRYTKADAEQEFNLLFRSRRDPLWLPSNLSASKPFEDYMMHYILRLANTKHMPVQIHTGMQEGNGNLLSNADPLLLNNLFLEYPKISFCILHAGFPFQYSVGALAKMFPNVYLDLCWLPIISPSAAEELLYQLLDLVPYNKIMAFGGDYGFVDGVYGHQCLARKCVTNALNRRMSEGLIDCDAAKTIADYLLYKNAYFIFFQGQNEIL